MFRSFFAQMMALTTLLLFMLPAHAGFRAYNSTTDLKIFDTIQCSTGLTCSRSKEKMTVIVNHLGSQTRVLATATTLTAAQCGSTIYTSGAIEVELPEASAVLGCRFTFIVGAAAALTIDPDAADIILILTNAAGDSLVADAAGESIVLEALSASQWAAVGSPYGTWTDTN